MAIGAAFPALVAAALFGASTPLAKLLVGDVSPLLLAGLLYLGSGIGLTALLAIRVARRPAAATVLRIPRGDWGWLLGAVVFGGILGPALLMHGLQSTNGATAALLLNVEGVLTAVIAWLLFGENADRRIVAGMFAIVAGGVVLSWDPSQAVWSGGALVIVLACLAWAVDNNLTRKVSTHDAMLIACVKGLLAGIVNSGLALSSGAALPGAAALVGAMAVGFFGYGLSLTLFVHALRTLGTARTGAYFSVAPLIGVTVALALWPAWPTVSFWSATALMALGVWLHVRERHEHDHTHEPIDHAHAHRHDEHHRHRHAEDWDGLEPHVHRHEHAVLTHRHRHFPDIHHRHPHRHRAEKSVGRISGSSGPDVRTYLE